MGNSLPEEVHLNEIILKMMLRSIASCYNNFALSPIYLNVIKNKLPVYKLNIENII